MFSAERVSWREKSANGQVTLLSLTQVNHRQLEKKWHFARASITDEEEEEQKMQEERGGCQQTKSRVKWRTGISRTSALSANRWGRDRVKHLYFSPHVETGSFRWFFLLLTERGKFFPLLQQLVHKVMSTVWQSSQLTLPLVFTRHVQLFHWVTWAWEREKKRKSLKGKYRSEWTGTSSVNQSMSVSAPLTAAVRDIWRDQATDPFIRKLRRPWAARVRSTIISSTCLTEESSTS